MDDGALCWNEVLLVFPGMRVGAAGVFVLVLFCFFPHLLLLLPKVEDKAGRVRVCENSCSRGLLVLVEELVCGEPAGTAGVVLWGYAVVLLLLTAVMKKLGLGLIGADLRGADCGVGVRRFLED